jgi:hypothetical protein
MTYQEALKQLEPYMEILEPTFLQKNLKTLEEKQADAGLSPIEHVALGITYHELCLVNYLRGKDKTYAPYAQKALDTLKLAALQSPIAAKPIVDAYITSARSLVASVKSNLIELIRVIKQYDRLIKRDKDVCYCPEFLQASLLENLPNLFGAHKKAAHRFKSIIAHKQQNPEYCSDKIISFCYLSLARFERSKDKKIALLQQSIDADKLKHGASLLASDLLKTVQ